MFTKKTSYGIRGLVNLASRKPGSNVLVKNISEQENIPQSFLNKIFQRLKRDGILESRRGVGGGFQLARPAQNINLKQIINALEGRLKLKKSIAGEGNDEITNTVFEKARLNIEKLFEGTTLYDLIKRKK